MHEIRHIVQFEIQLAIYLHPHLDMIITIVIHLKDEYKSHACNLTLSLSVNKRKRQINIPSDVDHHYSQIQLKGYNDTNFTAVKDH